MSLKERIRKEAHKLGFDKVGFTVPEIKSYKKAFLEWLKDGFHAEMLYMERNVEKRLNPRELYPDVKTIICLATNYYPGEQFPVDFKISRYAMGRDYHTVLKKKMRRLFAYIKQLIPEAEARFFVDSAPVLERVLAQQAGLGWIGKNTMLITREYGSWVFLCEIFINIKLEPDPPLHASYCGKCNKCIEACPTGALQAYRLNSSKCLSFINIESKAALPQWYSKKAGFWVFGCDICQEVCPWNRKPRKTREKDFLPKQEILSLSLRELSEISHQRFYQIFKATPVLRAGYDRIRQIAVTLIKQRKTNF